MTTPTPQDGHGRRNQTAMSLPKPTNLMSVPYVVASGKWKWVSANGLIHIHCDDIVKIASIINLSTLTSPAKFEREAMQ